MTLSGECEQGGGAGRKNRRAIDRGKVPVASTSFCDVPCDPEICLFCRYTSASPLLSQVPLCALMELERKGFDIILILYDCIVSYNQREPKKLTLPSSVVDLEVKSTLIGSLINLRTPIYQRTPIKCGAPHAGCGEHSAVTRQGQFAGGNCAR